MRSPEVCRLTGASYRMLDHWVTRGFITPSDAAGVGTGQRREFSTEDAVQIAVMVRLVAQGVEPGAAAELARIAREHDLPLVTITVDVPRVRAELATRIEAAA